MQTQVLFGSATKILSEFLSKRAPYAKVLLLSTPKTFFNKANAIIEVINKNGGKAVTVILEDDYSLSVESVSGLFSAPEDTRAVIALDDILFGCANYFATVKNVQSYLISYARLPSGIFSERQHLKNANVVDSLLLTEDRTYIVDFESDQKEFKDSLKPYLAGLIVKTVDKLILEQAAGYSVSQEFIKKADEFILSQAYSDSVEKATSEFIGIEKALAKSQNTISVDDAAAFLYCGRFYSDGYLKLKICHEILLRYYKALVTGDGLTIPDYRARTAVVNKLSGYDENVVLSSFSIQTQIFRSARLDDVKNLIPCIEKAVKVVEKILKDVDYNQAIEEEKLKLSINHAGDLPVSINGMTAIRELGL